MKRVVTVFAGLIILTTACPISCPASYGQPSAQKHGIRVSDGRELPRTRTISYDSETASLEGSLAPSAYLQPLGDGWQRGKTVGDGCVSLARNFKIPFAWAGRQNFLHVESATGQYEVIVNGKHAGFNAAGGTPAEFDITPYSVEGINELEIVIYGDDLNKPAGRTNDGISAVSESTHALRGEIYIVSQPRVRIRDYVASAAFEGDNANLELGVAVKSHLLNAKTVRLFYKLLSPSGREVATDYRDAEFGMRNEDTVRFFINVPEVQPWSHEKPNLYTLSLKLMHEGRYTEYVSYKLGLRTVGIAGGRLSVNSHSVPLSVVEYSCVGDSSAVSGDLLRLKKEGVNLLKVPRPQPRYFYEICDRIGLYVCDQADIDTGLWPATRRKGGNPSNDPAWLNVYLDRTASMYYTSRNHPSVIMFSLGRNSSDGYNLYESYRELKKAEASRPIIYIDAGGEWNTDAVSGKTAETFPEAVGGRMIFDAVRDERAAGKDPNPEIILTDSESGTYTLRNESYLTIVRGELTYTVRQGMRKVSQGVIPVRIAPRSSVEVNIPSGEAKAGKKLKYEVAFSAGEF